MTAVDAGNLRRARAVAERAAQLSDDPPMYARVAHVQALVESAQGSTRVAGRILFDSAGRLDEPATAIPMFAEAAVHAWSGGDRITLADAARRVEAFAPFPESLVPLAAVTRGLHALMVNDMAGGISLLRDAVHGAEQDSAGRCSFGCASPASP